MQDVSLSSLLSLLSSTGKGGRKCSTKLLDTIFVPGGGGSLLWFFTTKSGTLSKKKANNSLAGVSERFSRFALSNPNNTDKTIGVFVHGNGHRQTLSASALDELLSPNNAASLSEAGSYLQVYLRPYRGQEATVSCTCNSQSQSQSQTSSSKPRFAYSRQSSLGGSEALESSGNLQEQMEQQVEEIQACLLETRGLVVKEMRADFVVDDNEHVWLCNVPHCSVAPVAAEDEMGAQKENKGLNNGSSSSSSSSSVNASLLPLLKASALGSGDTPRSQVLASSEILTRSPDGAYCCAVGPDDLPGLRAWSLVSLASDGGGGQGGLSWAVEMDEYKPGNFLSPNPAVEAMRRQRAEARFKVPLLQVMVLRLADRILLGKETLPSEEAFEAAWRAVHERALSAAQGGDVETIVCGNTHAICRKLELLCQIGFVGSERPVELAGADEDGDDGDASQGRLRPRSESGPPGRVGVSAGSGINSRASSGYNEFGGAEELALTRQAYSAGRDERKSDRAPVGPAVGRGLVGGVRSLHLHQAFVEPSTQADSFFNSDMETLPEPERKTDRVMDVKPGASLAKKETNNLKKKKKGPQAGSGFRRDAAGMDEPPSVDLIAKFAAEKEKQQHLARQERIDAQRQAAAAALEEEQHEAERFYDDEGAGEYAEWPERTALRAPKRNASNNAGAKKKALSKARAKGGAGGGYQDEEDRLARLERAAQQKQLQQLQFQQQWDAGYNPQGSFAASVVSNSESDFMARAAQMGDPAALDAMDSLLSNNSLEGFPVHNNTHNDGNKAAHEKVSGALRSRVAQLEKQLQQMQTASERKDGEIDRLADRLKKATHDLDHARKWGQGELQRVKDEHEMDVIRLREQHAKQMAAIAMAPEPSAAWIGAPGAGISPTKQSSDAFQANRQLLEQLEILRSEQRTQLMRFSDERRALQAEASSRLLAQERQLKADVSDLRGQVTSLEDRVTHYSEEASAAKSRAESLAVQCRQLEQARLDAVEQQGKLRADLKNMQQSVNASYRLESQQGMTVGVDADTQIRLNEAKSDARSRQLVNKVDFLKAQLAAEQANAEEMREALSQNQRKMDELRDDFRAKIKEVEAMKHYAVEEAEKRVEATYESRMAELTTLQSKMMMMQGQLQDAFQDGALLKQREEHAKGAAARANAHQSILRAEIEQLKVQLSEVKLELEDSQAAGSSKQGNDAVIRRLDNERQYLKSQLASEITHKNEMQNALAQCQHQLNEVQRQWKTDVETLREQITNDKNEAVTIEQRLQASNITLEAEIARLESSNRDLKDAFVKCRDQVRMEQLAMENATSVNRRLQEQLETSKADLQRIKQVEEQSADAHRQQIAALKSAMTESEARNSKSTNKLKEELSTQYLLNSAAQMESMQLRGAFQEEKKALQRRGGAGRIVEMLGRWQQHRMSHALRVWSTNTTLLDVAKQFRGHVNELMKDTLNEVRAEKESALQSLTTEMLAVQEARVRELRSQFDQEKAGLLESCEEEKRIEIEKIHVELQQHLEEVEAHWNAETEACKRDGENALELARGLNEMKMQETEERCQLTLEDARAEHELALKEAVERTTLAASKQWSETMERELAALAGRHRDEVVSLLSDHTVATNSAAKQSRAAMETMRQDMLHQQEEALAAQQARFSDEIEALRDQFRLESQADMAQYQAQCDDATALARQLLHEETEQRIREMRVTWAEERDDLLRKQQEVHDATLIEKIDAHAKFVEVERVRAVKLESSKWRQALKDAEHRFDLEVAKAKAEGRAEKEKSTREQLAADAAAHETNLQAQADQHRLHVQGILRDHEDELAKQAREFEQRQLEAERKAEALTKDALALEFGDRTKVAVEEAWADSAKMWGAKLKKEEDRLDKFKQDVSAQIQQLAQERNDLQERVNQSDDMIRRMEIMNRTEVDNLRRDFQDEREMTELKFKNAKKLALKDLAEEQTATLDAVEEKYKDIAEARVKREKDKMSADMSRQIAQLQEESEQLITGLESAIGDLKQEKLALSEQLEKTATKLEDTEDSLFDLQQESKRRACDQSVSTWRTLVSVEKMRQRFKEGMDKFDEERQESEERAQRDFQRAMNEMTLAAMKLSALLMEVEEIRKKTHQTLVGYKSDELIEKRTLIKVLERDLERLTMERDSLEEQRDLGEEEMESLEGQVRELEEQIRDHNRTSAMQNGRINVAHARKKRRLDTELERVLELIEQRRINVTEIDDKINDKGKQRDDKESEMVQLEKELVSILVEQQRKVLGNIELLRGTTEEKTKLVCHVARLPYPPVGNPSIVDVEEMQRKDAEGRKGKEAEAEEARLVEEDKAARLKSKAKK